jgi:hypothetical protein
VIRPVYFLFLVFLAGCLFAGRRTNDASPQEEQKIFYRVENNNWLTVSVYISPSLNGECNETATTKFLLARMVGVGEKRLGEFYYALTDPCFIAESTAKTFSVACPIIAPFGWGDTLVWVIQPVLSHSWGSCYVAAREEVI